MPLRSLLIREIQIDFTKRLKDESFNYTVENIFTHKEPFFIVCKGGARSADLISHMSENIVIIFRQEELSWGYKMFNFSVGIERK